MLAGVSTLAAHDTHFDFRLLDGIVRGGALLHIVIYDALGIARQTPVIETWPGMWLYFLVLLAGGHCIHLLDHGLADWSFGSFSG